MNITHLQHPHEGSENFCFNQMFVDVRILKETNKYKKETNKYKKETNEYKKETANTTTATSSSSKTAATPAAATLPPAAAEAEAITFMVMHALRNLTA